MKVFGILNMSKRFLIFVRKTFQTNINEVKSRNILFSLSIIVFFCASFQAQDSKDSGNKIFEGVIRTLIFEDGKGTERHFLDTGNKKFEISLKDRSLVGSRVSVSGTLNSRNVITPRKIKVVSPARTVAALPISGSRTVLVLLVNFQSNPIQPPGFEEVVRYSTFHGPKSPNKYYQQVSGNQLRLVGRQQEVGDVYGYITLPLSDQDCLTDNVVNSWGTTADTIARSNGIDPSLYHSVIYLFLGSTPNCELPVFAEVGDIGSTATQRVWVVNAFDQIHSQYGGYSLTHELGHNLGLNHSSAYENCPTTSPIEACTGLIEYADEADVMGPFGYHLLSNYHRLRLGWLPGKLVTYDSPGTYYVDLASPSHPTKKATAAQVRLKDANGNFTGRSLYLEYRRNLPPFDDFVTIDDFVPSVPDPSVQLFTKGVTIRIGTEDLFDLFAKSYLIDTTTETATFADASLAPGNTYSNTYHGVSVSTISVNPLFGARVKIEISR